MNRTAPPTSRQVRAHNERVLDDALYLLDSAGVMFPAIAVEIRRIVPQILTQALGYPVRPSLVDELHEAKREAARADSPSTAGYWLNRADQYWNRILGGAA